MDSEPTVAPVSFLDQIKHRNNQKSSESTDKENEIVNIISMKNTERDCKLFILILIQYELMFTLHCMFLKMKSLAE